MSDIAQTLELLESDPANRDAFEKAEEHYVLNLDWEALVSLFERHEEALAGQFKKYWQRLIEQLEILAGELGADQRSFAQMQVGKIWQFKLERLDQSMLAYQKSFKTWPKNGAALDHARAIYVDQNNWDMVLRLYQIQLQVTEEPEAQADILFAIAQIHIDHLRDRPAAVPFLKRAVELDPVNEEAQRLLDIAEGRLRDWKHELDTLKDDVGSAGDSSARADALVALATFLLEEAPDDLDDPVPYIRSAYETDPSHDGASALMADLHRREGDFAALGQLLRAKADNAPGRDERLDALVELAHVQITELDEKSEAVATFRDVLEINPAHPTAMKYAATFYEEDGNWADLVEVYEKALKVIGRGEGSADLLASIAETYWQKLDDSDSAEKYFKKLKLVDAKNPRMLRFYVERHRENGDARRWVSTLQTLRDVSEGDEQLEIARDLARVAEEEQDKPDKAIDAWKWIARKVPGDEQAVRELRRLLYATEKWNALLEVLKTQVDDLPEESVVDKIGVLGEMVDIYRDKLNLEPMVISTYNSILELDPENEVAFEALVERYESASRWNDLVKLLDARVEHLADEDDQVHMLHRIAGIWRENLGNAAKAAGPLERIADIDPKNREVLAELRSIYESRRDYEKLIGVSQREVELLPDDERADALRDMAKVAKKRLKDDSRASSIFEQLLRVTDGTDEAARGALEKIYSASESWEDWARVAQMRVDQGEASVSQKLDLADVYASKLSQIKPAVTLWREVLEADSKQDDARRKLGDALRESRDWDGLEDLTEQTGDWQPLVDMFDVYAQQADDDSERLDLLERIARLADEQLGNANQVISAYESILEIKPEDRTVIRKLEDLYRESGEPSRRAEMLTLLLDGEDDEEAAQELRRALGNIYADDLEDPRAAFAIFSAMFEADPTDADVRNRTLELCLAAGEADAWFERLKTMSAQMPRGAERIDNYRAIARLAAGPVQSLPEALDFFERVRVEIPDDQEAIAGLTRLYTESERWDRLAEILRAKMEHSDDDARVDTGFELAELLRERLDSDDEAIEVYNEILDLDSGNLKALRALRGIYESREDWSNFVGACERELALAESDADRLPTLYELARMYATELGDTSSSLQRYAKIVEVDAASEWGEKSIVDLKNMLSDDDTREAAATVVEPVLRDLGRWADVIGVLEARLLEAEEVTARELYGEMARIYESHLEDPESAYFTLGRLSSHHRTSEAIWIEMERLARADGILNDVVMRWRAAVETHGPDEMPALLGYIARVAEDDVADLESALWAWQQRRLLDEFDEEAAAGLERLARKSGDESQLVQLLVERAESASPDKQVEMWAEAADIFKESLGQNERAIELYERVLETDPSHTDSFTALEGLYLNHSTVDDLVDLYDRRRRVLSGGEADELRLKSARLLADAVGDYDRAAAGFGKVLDSDPSNMAALAGLESVLGQIRDGEDHHILRREISGRLNELYRINGMWQKLVGLGPIRLSDAETDSERIDVHLELADVYEAELEDHQHGFIELLTAVRLGFEREDLRKRLERWAESLDRVRDVIGLYESKVEGLKDADLAYATRFRLGELCQQVEAPEAAVAWFERASELEPGMDAPLAKLQALYEQLGQADQRAQLLRRRATITDDIDERLGMLRDAAKIYQAELGDMNQAIEVLQEARDHDPDDRATIELLDPMLDSAGLHRALVRLLEHRIVLANDSEERLGLRLRSARLREESLEDLEGAVEDLLAATDLAPNDDRILAEMDRLFGAQSDFVEQANIIERRLPLVEGADRVELLVRQARLMAQHLDDPYGAVRKGAEALEADPEHAGAREVLESLSSDESVAEEAMRALEESYSKSGSVADQVRILGLRAETAHGPDRVDLLVQIAALREKELEDVDGAFAAQLDAYKASRGEARLRPETERLAGAAGRWAAFAMAAEEVFDDVDTVERRALRFRVAEIYNDELESPEEAAAHWRAALDDNPTDIDALRALDGYYAETEAWTELVEILSMQVDASSEPDERVETLLRMATLQETALSANDEAIETLRRARGVAPDEERAVDALRRLLRTQEEWDELSGLLEERYRSTEDSAVRGELAFDLAELYRGPLEDAERAFGFYPAAIEAEHRLEDVRSSLVSIMDAYADDAMVGPKAATMVEPLLTSAEAWEVLGRSYEIRAAEAHGKDRAELLGKLSTLQSEKLGDASAAFNTLRLEMLADANRAELWDRAQAQAEELDLIETLVETFQQMVEESDCTPETRAELLYRSGRIQAMELDEVGVATDLLRQLLLEAPDHEGAQTLLEEVLHRGRQWEDLIDLYRARADQAKSDADRGVELLRIAYLQSELLDDPDAAIDVYREALSLSEHQSAAREGVVRLLRIERRWDELADVLRSEANREADPVRKATMLASLGDLERDRLDDLEGAIDNYERALDVQERFSPAMRPLEAVLGEALDAEGGGDWGREVARILEGVYDPASEWKKLVDVYEVQRAASEMPEDAVAVLRKLAKLYEEQGGDTSEAFATMARALTARPEDTEVQDELRRLSKSLENWDELAGILRGAAENTNDPTTQLGLLMSVAGIYESEAPDVDRAIGMYREALAVDELHEPALEALERILEGGERWSELVDVLESHASITDTPEKRIELYGSASREARQRVPAKGFWRS